MAQQPEIGRHLASLNLFIEADGKLYVTVASADIQEVRTTAVVRGVRDSLTPNDMVLALVRRAENLQEGKL